MTKNNGLYTLTIDGGFFAQQMRTTCGLTFMETPEKDKQELFTACARTLANVIGMFSNVLDNVIIAKDYSSWRKFETPVFPKESELTEKEETYKDNRSGEKDYDVKLFFDAMNEFYSLLSSKLNISIVSAYKAEADDTCYVISEVNAKLGKKTLLYTSDGDYKHLVNENTLLYKLPKRQIYKSCVVGNKASGLDAIFNNAIDNSFKVYEAVGGSTNVVEINPFFELFFKIINGDKKDNVPPIFFWLSNGVKPRQMKPANSHITKTFKKLGYEEIPTDFALLYNEEFIKGFIKEILIICKKERDIEHTIKVFKSNRKLLYLNKAEIPKDITKSILDDIKTQLKSSKPIKISTLTEYQNYLGAIGKTEANHFFSNFNL